MTKPFILAAVSAASMLAVQPARAQHGHAPKPAPAPHAAATAHGTAGSVGHTGKPSAAAPTIKSPGTHATAPKPNGSSSRPPKTTQAPKSHGSGNHEPKSAKSTTNTAAGAKRSTTSTGTSTVSAKTVQTTVTLTPVQQKLQRNVNLTSKLQSRLPVGTDVTLASAGFKNLGQFVAAVNVSNNLGIPFTELRARMVDDGLSLGQAIQKSKPSANTEFEVERAERDADVLIIEAEKSPQPQPKPRRAGSGGAHN